MLRVDAPCHRFSLRIFAKPLLCRAVPGTAMPLLSGSVQCPAPAVLGRAYALLFDASPCRRNAWLSRRDAAGSFAQAKLRIAKPLQRPGKLRCANAVPCPAEPLHRLATPRLRWAMPGSAMPKQRLSLICCAFAAPCYASPMLCHAQLGSALPCRRDAAIYETLLCRCLALRSLAPPLQWGYSSSRKVSQDSSRQVKRPLPELRH